MHETCRNSNDSVVSTLLVRQMILVARETRGLSVTVAAREHTTERFMYPNNVHLQSGDANMLPICLHSMP